MQEPAPTDPARAAPRRIIVGISGASGFVYGVRLLELLRASGVETHLVISKSAQVTMAYETDHKLADVVALADRHHRNDDLAASRGWWVISDEIYVRIAYDGTAPGALDVAERRDNLIVVNGVAKAYAMTGWRIGWTISPAPVAKAMTALQSHTTSNATTVAQYAALAALTLGEPVERTVREMVDEFRARRDAALPILRQAPGVTVLPPEGAFYFDLKAPGAGSVPDAGAAFSLRLLEEFNVAVVPGAAFRTPDWFRISYAAEKSQVIEACRRVVRAAESHGAP